MNTSDRSLTETRAMSASFRHFYFLDRHNAAVHMSPVRYSPITFRLAECLSYEGRLQDMMYDGDQTYVEVHQVMKHAGRYPEDRGRIAEDPVDTAVLPRLTGAALAQHLLDYHHVGGLTTALRLAADEREHGAMHFYGNPGHDHETEPSTPAAADTGTSGYPGGES